MGSHYPVHVYSLVYQTISGSWCEGKSRIKIKVILKQAEDISVLVERPAKRTLRLIANVDVTALIRSKGLGKRQPLDAPNLRLLHLAGDPPPQYA